MSNTTQPPGTQQFDVQSIAQQQAEIDRLHTETLLLQARIARARAEREARFHARHPLLSRHGWLQPSIALGVAMCVGGAFAFMMTKFAGT